MTGALILPGPDHKASRNAHLRWQDKLTNMIRILATMSLADFIRSQAASYLFFELTSNDVQRLCISHSLADEV